MLAPGGGAVRKPSTISGSSRGSQYRETLARTRWSLAWTKVRSYTWPQIGSWTLYSSQMPRLVKPILRPTGRSPSATRRSWMRRATS